MKTLAEFGRWISETFLGPALKELFANQLELLGLGAGVISLLAPILGFLVARLAWKLLEPPPPIEWSSIDIANAAKLSAAFDDVHILATASRELGEDAAQTLDAFANQVSRLQVARSLTNWDKVRTDDDGLIQRLFARKDIVQHIASLSNSSPARNIEEFRTQLLIVQQSRRSRA
ncbi:MAG: hypothetical protein R3D27_14275 [Hyphomicrobiaceae bacterium]